MTAALLESHRPTSSLRPDVGEMTAIIADAQTARIVPREGIAVGETRTSDGLALSPAMAAMCADDFVRTVAFIRGLHAAIVDVRQRCPDRPARVLYAGCGPYATLVVPLMTMFTPAEAKFVLLDIHHESIASVTSILDTLGLSDRVARLGTINAASYRVCPDRRPDVIVMELLRACLDAEPQVAVTRHLLGQAPDAILIPEEVRIDLALVDPSQEFRRARHGTGDGTLRRDRGAVATVFVLNRKAVESWKRNGSDRLPGCAGRIPASTEPRYQPMLLTTVRIYRDHVLGDYDSGLTYPRVLSVRGGIAPGDTIQFHYRLGRAPRLEGEVAASRSPA